MGKKIFLRFIVLLVSVCIMDCVSTTLITREIRDSLTNEQMKYYQYPDRGL
jgi:hypothetical protein